MSTQIETWFVKAYESSVHTLAQQKMSRLRPAVRNETFQGRHDFFDRIGATAAVKKTTRFGNTPVVDTPHSRRRLACVDYEISDYIDKQDRARLGSSPDNIYVQAQAMAIGRAYDDEIITAFDGSAWSGETGTTEVTWETTQDVPAGGTGLTISKLISAKELLDAAEVGDPDEPRFIVCQAKQITNMLNQTEVKSTDYNTVAALVEGKVDTFMGFKFIRSQRLGLYSAGIRKAFCWIKPAMILGTQIELTTRMDERPDKSYALQVYSCSTHGATRMEEAGVVRILCAE